MRPVLLMLFALIVVPVEAQTMRADSTRQPVVVQGVSPGVQAVRQRIRAIRGQPQRVVQPIIVVAPSPAPAPPQAAALPAPLTPQERQALDQVRPGLADRVQSYYDVYRSYAPPVIVNIGPDGTPQVPISPFVPDTVVVGDTSRTGITPPPLPSAQPVMPRVPVASVREVERAILETGLFRAVGVNFEFDRSRLLDGSEAFLDPVGEVLRRYPDLRVEIGGHTDSIGSEAYNERLSQARAETVRQYLIERFEIAPERLVARGYGESRPIVTNANPTGRTLNRRVEFTVLDE